MKIVQREKIMNNEQVEFKKRLTNQIKSVNTNNIKKYCNPAKISIKISRYLDIQIIRYPDI